MSRPTYTREFMAGTIFAGGRVSPFQLTSLARHSVRRPPRRFPRPLEGLDSLRASGRVEQASQPNTDVRRAAALPGSVALLLFNDSSAPIPLTSKPSRPIRRRRRFLGQRVPPYFRSRTRERPAALLSSLALS